jgi:hypothetical protein
MLKTDYGPIHAVQPSFKAYTPARSPISSDALKFRALSEKKFVSDVPTLMWKHVGFETIAPFIGDRGNLETVSPRCVVVVHEANQPCRTLTLPLLANSPKSVEMVLLLPKLLF